MSVLNELEKYSVGKIRAEIKGLSIDQYEIWIEKLSDDSRKGVRQLADSLKKKRRRYETELKKIRQKKEIENALRSDSCRLICGIDEVGRGPLAGPVVAGAVILPADSEILYINDSKQVSAKKRESLSQKIKEEAVAYAFGSCSPKEIDELNILNATKNAMVKAVKKLQVRPDILLIDAVSIPSNIPVKSIIHGDALCYSIAAASIIAKVERDCLMKEYHQVYPQYGFDHNVGYGTQEHIDAIIKFGPSPIHRKSFIKNFIEE